VSQVRAWTALGSMLLAVGCNASITHEGLHPSGNGGQSSGGSTGAAGGPNTLTLGRDAVAARCETTQLAPPQLRRLTAVELERTLRDIFPSLAADWSGVRLGADPVSPLGFSNDARTLVVASQTAQELLGTADDVAKNVTTPVALAALLPACAAEASPARACADQLIQTVAARLFRRAVSTEEAADYGALFDTVAAKSDFLTGAHWMLVAMIQSPSTVYRSELGSADGASRKLLPEELASELSYTFGGTAPSAELLTAAQHGAFATPEARVAKARELLATPAGREQLHQFLAEWSGYGRVASKTKTTVDHFDLLRGSMQQETKLFFEEAVVNRKGGMRELLTANYTFVDSSLAGLYGFGAAPGSDFAQAQRPMGQGLGLLAQGSMLAGSAHADASSPTLRGLVVYERLLCHQRPPVPPNVGAIGAAMPGTKTTRERYEIAHRTAASCAGCHQFFDPLGFGLEHFDEAGRYRADEAGLAIDATGQALAYPDTSVVFSFDGEDDLAQKLAARPEVSDCVSGLAAAYAFAGAGGRTCLAEDARAAFGRGDVGVLDYFAELAGSPSFAERAP
jgi:Protein of unknown function (DUF1588)/Protein of unknown function (DUF1592)/Protein of unknown function (DUF1595)/Protein of unknown function (DUF1587)